VGHLDRKEAVEVEDVGNRNPDHGTPQHPNRVVKNTPNPNRAV
jgi:hypothetical protein